MSLERLKSLTTKDALNHSFPWPPLSTMPLPARVVPLSGTIDLRTGLHGESITQFPGDIVFRQVLADVTYLTNQHLSRRRRPFLPRESIIGEMKGPTGKRIWGEKLDDSIHGGLVSVVDESRVVLAVSPIALATALEHDDTTVLVVEPDWWREIEPPLLSVSDIVLNRALYTKSREHFLNTDPNIQDNQLIMIDIGDWATRHGVRPEQFIKRLQRLSQYGCLTINNNILSVSRREHQALTWLFDITRGSGEKPIFVAKPPVQRRGPVEEPRQMIGLPKTYNNHDNSVENTEDVIIVGPNRLNEKTGTFKSADIEITLGPTKTRIMAYFLRHPNELHSRRILAQVIYGRVDPASLRSIKQQIGELRQSIEIDPSKPQLIQKNGFQGYFLNVPEVVDPKDVIEIGDCTLHLRTGMFKVGDRLLVGLSAAETILIEMLMRSTTIVSRHELFERIYPDGNGNELNIASFMSILRKKIELDPDNPILISSVPSGGWVFNRPSSANDEKAQQGVIDVGGHKIDLSTRKYTYGEKVEDLTQEEIDIVSHLLIHPNMYFTAKKLAELVYGKSTDKTIRRIIICVFNIRQKIEIEPSKPLLLKLVRGRGYYFSIPEIEEKKGSISVDDFNFNPQSGIFIHGDRKEVLTLEQAKILALLMQLTTPITITGIINILQLHCKESAVRMKIRDIREKIELNPKRPTILMNEPRRGYFFNRSDW